MPFKEVSIGKIIKEKSKEDPEFRRVFHEASAELDLVAQIIRTRKSKGLTQKDVAERSGLTQQMVFRIEKGNTLRITKTWLKSSIELVSK